MHDLGTPDLVFAIRICGLRFEWQPRLPTANGEVTVLDEGIDEHSSLLGRPVHWRIEQRGSTEVHCRTFLAPAAEVRRLVRGDRDLARVLRRRKQSYVVTIETILGESSAAGH